MGVNLPYPIPDPATGEWDPFALKQDMEFLARSIDSITAKNNAVILRRDVGNPIKDIVSTDVETSLFATPLTIPGGSLSNRRLRVEVLFDHLQNSGIPLLTFRLKYGGTTLDALVLSIAASATLYDGQFLRSQLVSIEDNVQGTQRFDYTFANATLISETLVYGSVDSTVNQTFDLTAQWAVADAQHSLRIYMISVEFL
jgi:hypothetical protein